MSLIDRGRHFHFRKGHSPMRDIVTDKRIVHCDDAPVSTFETDAEVAARLASAAPTAGRHRWDEREIARSALSDMAESDRAAFLTDLMCELRGPGARRALAIARNRITSHLHDLITLEYDAEVAKAPGQHVAELARSSA